MAGFDNEVVYADNVDFSGGFPVTPQITADGELLIGSTTTPNIRVGSLVSSNGSIDITVGPGSIDIEANGGAIGQTLTGNDGTPRSPVGGNWNVLGDGSITVQGSVGTETVQLTGLTNHNLLIGAGTTTITKVAPSATSGVPVISQGAAADPAFGTAVVAGGGTGQVTLTNHGVLIGQATSPVAATAAGTAGQVLQSGGASADPTYSTTTYPSTAGTTGTILRSNGTNIVNTTATYPTTVSQGDVIYGSASNVISGLAKSASATRYLANTGSSNSPQWDQVNVANGITGTVPVANGGLNSTGITGIVAGTGSAYNGRTITGTSNQIAVTNGNGSAGNPTLAFASIATFTSTQPSMLAYKSANTTNATGDATLYTVIFDTETYDQGSNYDNTTGIFTCPVTGNYMITGNVGFTNFGTSTAFTSYVTATPLYQTYNSSQGVLNVGVLGNIWCPFSSILRLTSGTTITIVAQGSAGTKNNTIIGGGAYATWLSIVLVN
jgi:hypothetical protein